ncbi:MAG: AMP-binding protein [Phycisphaerales bacterium]|nr:AMP-binding protein [Phycisphaerales bacterium]
MRIARDIVRTLLRAPGRVAVVDDQRAWKSWRIYLAALHVAREIARTTDRPRVGIMLPTAGVYPVALLATWMLGRTAVPLNYLLKADDIAFIVEDAELDTVVTVEPMLEMVGGLPDGVKAIRMDTMSFRGLPPLRRCARRPDDHIAVVLYTSGTSGRPKGVMLSIGNLVANVGQCVERAGFARGEVLLGVLPQFHTFGLTVLTLLPLTVGCLVVYTARFRPAKILDLMRRYRPTAFIAIPSMYNALLNARSATAEDLASLRCVVSGGEPLPAAVFDGFLERFGVRICEGYGLTETSPVTNWCLPDEHRRRSVGRAVCDCEQRIVAPDGTVLGPDAEGEIRIKGPNVMQGYFKRPEETAAAFDGEGYFRTGDMGRFDADGFLYITGRIKEMLIIGGENVFPREIEEVLNRHPDVHDSAVIGVPDESRGEVAMAFVELAEGATFDETALRSHCRSELPQFKVPREIRVVEALPRNATGKIVRRALTAETGSAASQP